MKKTISLIFSIFVMFALHAQQIDTTITIYNFNNLNVGNLNLQDQWKTTLAGTTVDVKVEAGLSYDGTKAIRFTKNGGGVNASGNRPLDTIFPNFTFADSGTYYIYFDIKREYWGSEFGIAYDMNNDGKINQSQNGEKAIRFKSAQNGGTTFWNASGTSYTSTTPINSGWNRVEIKFEPYANSGIGAISIRFKPVNTTTWTTLFTNIPAGLDTSASNQKNPALWDQVFFHFTGSNSGLDNLEFWKIAAVPPPPNNAPTDLILTSDTISENKPSHTFIGRFRTLDPDSNDTHTYSFVSGAGDGDNGDFMITDSTLWSSIMFDYEDTTMQYIRVKTTDQDGASFEKAFVIYILDVNETNPGFEELNKSQVKLYPNPASDVILMDFTEGASIKNVKLVSMDGRLVKELSAEGSHIKMDVTNLKTGNYFIIIEDTAGNRISRKVQILK